MIRKLSGVLFFVAALSGCATGPVALVNPPTATINNDLVSGSLKLLCDKAEDCKTFELTLNNLTDETVEIDWNRSYYINNSKADGGLYFDGIVVAQRNNPRSPDIILPKSQFSKKLVPNNNLNLALFPLAHWETKAMVGPSQGIYLTIKTKTKEEVINRSVDASKIRN
jgi:hypothetical protein